MPRWKELKRFCDRDGWELYKDTDHYFYRKIDESFKRFRRNSSSYVEGNIKEAVTSYTRIF